jgi:hypothetical protein
MCDFEEGFILCTCLPKDKPIVHYKNSRKHKNKPPESRAYRWYLSRFVGEYEPLMEGIYELPSKDLGKGLTEEWVLLHLNHEKCFDFEYAPKEGDTLVLNGEKLYQYMSFIFRQGIWEVDRYNGFSTILELEKQGEIKPMKNT